MSHSDTHADLTPFLETDTEITRQDKVLKKWFKTNWPDIQAVRCWLNELPVNLQQFLRRRSLASEILLLQLVFSLVIGLFAVGALWLASNRAIEDNMRNWGEQWLTSLDDIAMPLYISNDSESYLGVEEYVKKFPEISFVRFYDEVGELVFEDYRVEPLRPISPVPVLTLMGMVDKTDDAYRHGYLLDAANSEQPLMRVGKSIWTESLTMDGLLGLDLSDASTVEETLVGFVELGLDASIYQADLEGMLGVSLRWGFLLLLLLSVSSWFVYRRALRPLSQLQAPLKRLAEGHTDFEVSTTGHSEVVAIADALNTTVSALNERDKKLRYLANNDQLTGLFNRHRFTEELSAELERLYSEDITSALLFIDLDHFKYVNDTAGHATGDRLLKEVSSCLLAGVRDNDTVARFGGDEFVVLISDVDEQQMKSICKALIHNISEHSFVEKNETFTVRCSIGATMIMNTEFSTADLLSQADMACHKAKNAGRNRFECYESSSSTLMGMANQIGLSRQINEALQNDSLMLQYQPIIDIKTNLPSHYEALVRMRVKDAKGRKKLLLPDAFIPAASRFDLMVHIDRWVICHAIKQLAEARKDYPDTCFTLNVSGNMFETHDFSEFLQTTLAESGVPIDAIVLEITEQVAVRTLGRSGKRIDKLAGMGCKFALDDFGAGYSSYSYLKTLPVDYIKIDGSFIHNIVDDVIDQKIVASIVEIAHATGKQTIAEYVASKEIYNKLRELEVDFAQGHYLGKAKTKLVR